MTKPGNNYLEFKTPLELIFTVTMSDGTVIIDTLDISGIFGPEGFTNRGCGERETGIAEKKSGRGAWEHGTEV